MTVVSLVEQPSPVALPPEPPPDNLGLRRLLGEVTQQIHTPEATATQVAQALDQIMSVRRDPVNDLVLAHDDLTNERFGPFLHRNPAIYSDQQNNPENSDPDNQLGITRPLQEIRYDHGTLTLIQTNGASTTLRVHSDLSEEVHIEVGKENPHRDSNRSYQNLRETPQVRRQLQALTEGLLRIQVGAILRDPDPSKQALLAEKLTQAASLLPKVEQKPAPAVAEAAVTLKENPTFDQLQQAVQEYFDGKEGWTQPLNPDAVPAYVMRKRHALLYKQMAEMLYRPDMTPEDIPQVIQTLVTSKLNMALLPPDMRKVLEQPHQHNGDYVAKAYQEYVKKQELKLDNNQTRAFCLGILARQLRNADFFYGSYLQQQTHIADTNILDGLNQFANKQTGHQPVPNEPNPYSQLDSQYRQAIAYIN